MTDQNLNAPLSGPQIESIRGTLLRMLAQQARQADIDAYLRSVGMPDPGRREPGVSIPVDMTKSLGTGVAEGGINLAGSAGDALRTGDAGMRWLSDNHEWKVPPAATPKQPLPFPRSEEWLIPDSRDIRNYVEGRFGKLYEPQTFGGHVARSVGQMWPNGVLPGSTAWRIANVGSPGTELEFAL